MSYTAPLKEMQFVLNNIADLPSVLALPGYEDHSTDLVDAILEEASKFAGEVLAPLNWEGDKGHKLADAVDHSCRFQRGLSPVPRCGLGGHACTGRIRRPGPAGSGSDGH